VLTRVVVGLVGLVVVVGLTWLGGFAFVALALVAALFGGYEFYWMLGQGGFRPQIAFGLAWLALLALGGWQPAWFPLLTVLTFGLIAVLSLALIQHDQPVHSALATGLPAVYLGVMMAQGIALRLLPEGFWWLLLGFGVAWGSDAAAYFTGVTLGRHKIWPRLSPKKTWEGTVAGWLGGAAVAVLVVWATPLPIGLGWAALLGLIGGVLGFFGDLSISMIKRQVGVKDSGHFFPGHGGMLDRLDSMLFVLPFVYQAALFLT
jgi:phosphatidate cytidylyltransferase